MTPEDRVREALHALVSGGRPDEAGAYDRFLRRHARRVRLEAAAGGVMVLVLLLLAASAPRLLPVADRTGGGQRPPHGRLTVEVTAYQWGWRFAYRDGEGRVASRSGMAPELVVPVGEPVRFRLTSADIVHSFSLPDRRFERDAIPGETIAFGLRFDRVGVYPGRCAVYCGLAHAEMRFTVKVLPRDAFWRWLRAASAGPGP
jgi:cytochrome c oxidase subunit II